MRVLRKVARARLFVLALLVTSSAQANEALWTKLTEGGHVVLMRHASVSKGPGQGNPLLRDPSCRKERNLSSEGEREARVVGEAFRKRSIRVAEVRHSPYCRTADTARIAFGNATPVGYLSLREVLDTGAAAAQTAKMSEVIGSYAGKGNLVLITHEPNINAVSFETLKHADLLVLRPRGGDRFEELGVIAFDSLAGAVQR